MIIDVGLKFFVAFRANTAEMNVIEDDEDEILHTGDGEHQIAAQEWIPLQGSVCKIFTNTTH